MKKEQIIVVGAGAFGAWTALHLQERGHQVTLIDAYGAGNSRASSGDETRVIRSVYVDEVYAKMAMRALSLWKEYQARWNTKLLYQSSVLSMLDENENRWAIAKNYFNQYDWKYEELTNNEFKKRFPLLNPEGVSKAVIEQESGFLLARMGCQAVLNAFVKAGGKYEIASVKPSNIQNEQLRGIELSDGSKRMADRYIFACGSWLGKLFPEEIGNLIQSTRQEVYYFGLPKQEASQWQQLPIWLDFVPNYENTMFYGIPASGSDVSARGFKAGEDKAGPIFDPDSDDRTISEASLNRVRSYLAYRFPSLKNAPVSESRVCQYESTADAHFLVDTLPTAQNVWVMGGGSGHGYKMGAALGEYMCQYLFDEVPQESLFAFDRFQKMQAVAEMRR